MQVVVGCGVVCLVVCKGARLVLEKAVETEKVNASEEGGAK